MTYRTIKIPSETDTITFEQAYETARELAGVDVSHARRAMASPKRKPNAAFMKPMSPSSVLAAVIGRSPIPRTEVTKKLWDYIKKNKLQDAVNKQQINSDEKLRRIFGGKKRVSMFEMTKLVSSHLK